MGSLQHIQLQSTAPDVNSTMTASQEQPELSHNSRLCRQVLQGAEVIMATKQAACWNAGVKPQHVIALLASVAGWCG